MLILVLKYGKTLGASRCSAPWNPIEAFSLNLNFVFEHTMNY